MNTQNIADLIGRTAAKRLSSIPPDRLPALSTEDLRGYGLTLKQAQHLAAAVRLAADLVSVEYETKPRISSPQRAIEYCRSEFASIAGAQQEEFWILTLATKLQPIRKHQITRGTLSNSLVHPREVFRPAIADASSKILSIHNHPSGDCTPSDQDFSVFDRLDRAGEIVGIAFIDHMIISRENVLSVRDFKNGGGRWSKTLATS